MKKASNQFFYEVYCDMWADGVGSEHGSILLTFPEFKEFKKCVNILSWQVFIDSECNIPAYQRMKVTSWKKRLVTKRYYQKYNNALNGKSEVSRLLYELNGYIEDKKYRGGKVEQTKDKEDDGYEDEPYHQLDCVLTLDTLDITATIVLSNTEFLALKKYHDPKNKIFSVNEYFGKKVLVYLKSWKERVVSKKDYEFLCKGLHTYEWAKKFLKRIEKWVSADEKKEIAAFVEANNLSDDEDKIHKVRSDYEEDEDDDEAEIEEKPLKKNVKKY